MTSREETERNCLVFRLGASYYSGCTIPFEQFLSLCKSLHMEFVEIQMEYPFTPSEMDPGSIMDMEALLSSFNLSVLIHGPIHDSNLSSLKEGIRRASLEQVIDCVDFAQSVGSPHVVIHAGTCPFELSHLLIEHAQASFRMSLSFIAAYANDRGIRIGIENGPAGRNPSTVARPKEHLALVSEFEDLGVRSVLDVGHAHTLGLDPVEYATTLSRSLIELHVHDNSGRSDDHLRLGEGTVSLKALLKTVTCLGFAGPTILELHTREHLADGAAFFRTLEESVVQSSIEVP